MYGASLASTRCVPYAGLTSTSPAIASPFCSASRVTSVPPIDSPAAKTVSQRAATSS